MLRNKFRSGTLGIYGGAKFSDMLFVQFASPFFFLLLFHAVSVLAAATLFFVRNSWPVMNAHGVAFPSVKNECRTTQGVLC